MKSAFAVLGKISRNPLNPRSPSGFSYCAWKRRTARDVQPSRLSHDPYLSRLPLSLLGLSQLKRPVNFPANRARSRLIIQTGRIAVYSLSNCQLFACLNFPASIRRCCSSSASPASDRVKINALIDVRERIPNVDFQLRRRLIRSASVCAARLFLRAYRKTRARDIPSARREF